jgi:hypothetical protein
MRGVGHEGIMYVPVRERDPALGRVRTVLGELVKPVSACRLKPPQLAIARRFALVFARGKRRPPGEIHGWRFSPARRRAPASRNGAFGFGPRYWPTRTPRPLAYGCSMLPAIVSSAVQTNSDTSFAICADRTSRRGAEFSVRQRFRHRATPQQMLVSGCVRTQQPMTAAGARVI